MKLSIVFLFVFLFFADGRNFLDNMVSKMRVNDAPPTALVGINVTWTFTSGINLTQVTIVVKKLGAGEWAASGLSQKIAMVRMIK